MSYNPDTDIPNLEGKVVVITGGTSGIGRQTILALSKHSPARIFFTGRDEDAANAVITDAKAVSPATDLAFLRCDHKSLESVESAASAFLSRSERLDVLICNAGIMCGPPGWTNNGYEIQFGVNYLAHALWIQKLLPLLQRTSEIVGDARIVFLTSTAFAIAPKQGIVFEALKAERENNTFGSKWTRYGQSKLAMVLYGKQLAKRYPNITSISVHPGVIRTSLIYDLPFVDRLFIEAITLGQKIGVEEGAYTTCWAATAPRNENLMSGGIYQPVGKPLSETKLSSNVNLGDRLWNWTAEHLKPYIVSSRAQGLITPTGGYPVTSALEKLHKLPSV